MFVNWKYKIKFFFLKLNALSTYIGHLKCLFCFTYMGFLKECGAGARAAVPAIFGPPGAGAKLLIIGPAPEMTPDLAPHKSLV